MFLSFFFAWVYVCVYLLFDKIKASEVNMTRNYLNKASINFETLSIEVVLTNWNFTQIYLCEQCLKMIRNH